MTAYLTVTDGLGTQRRVALDKPVTTIGRHADNDLQILGPSVSRKHAEVVADQDAFFIVDRESKGGTFVNEERVARRRLRHLDRIRLGGGPEFEIQFIDDRFAGRDMPTAPSRVSAASSHTELQHLARFLEVNQALKISLSIDEVLRLIVDSAIEITQADRGALLLRAETGELEFRVARDRDRRTLSSDSFGMSRTAVEQAFRDCRSVVVADTQGEESIGTESVLRLDLRTIVCIPLLRFQISERVETTGMHRRESTGVLYVDSRHAAAFLTRSAVTLLESLAFEAAKALEGVRLLQQEEEKNRMEREFAMAREVQVSILTTSALDAGYADFAAESIPSRYVDGDFYDLISLEGGAVGLVLGDVSGKGISAALLASMAEGVLFTQLNAGIPLASVMAGLNRMLVLKSSSWRFITLFCAVLDPRGLLRYVNAGHNPPVLLRASGEVEFLSSGSMVVGAMESAVYHESSVQLSRGDLLVAFTDGLTEAVDGNGEMFGEKRLVALLRSAPATTAREVRDRILSEIAAFTRGLPQDDDITLLVTSLSQIPAPGPRNEIPR